MERRVSIGPTAQGRFAELIRSSQSRFAKMIAADPSLSLNLIIRSLFALGTSKSDIAKTISGAAPVKAV